MIPQNMQTGESTAGKLIYQLDEVLSVFQWNEDRKKRLHAEQVRRVNSAIFKATRVIVAK